MPYLHYEKDKNDLIKKYFIALIPFILFGIYKNGILLYQNDLINFKHIFIPIYFFVISIIIGLLVSFIRKEESKENILFCLILACTTSINTNMFIYPILLFVCLFIIKYIQSKKKLEFNTLALVHLVMLLALLINNYNYLNIAEKLNKFNYDLFDQFLGLTTGGIATTSLFCSFISLSILISNKFYKKNIAIWASISYFLCLIIMFFIKQDSSILSIALNGTAYFAFIFVASDLYISPNTNKGMIIYGILIGLFSGLFSLLNMCEAPFIVILIMSFFCPIINKLTKNKSKNL